MNLHIEIEAIVVIVLLAAMQWFGKLPKLSGDGPWMDFVKANFDKLLLSIIFIACMLYVRRSISFGVDDAFINWAQGITGQIVAALLTLMVAAQKKPADPPNTTVSTVSTTKVETVVPPKPEDAGK
jgi:hypothetical protein